MLFRKPRVFIGLNGWAETLIDLASPHHPSQVRAKISLSKRMIRCSEGRIFLQDIALPNGVVLAEYLQEERIYGNGRRACSNVYTALKDISGNWVAESRWKDDAMLIFSTPSRVTYPISVSRSSNNPRLLISRPATNTVLSFLTDQT